MIDEASIYAGLTEIFHDVFMDDQMKLAPDLSAKDVSGWDSFRHIELMVCVEERFGIKLNTREMDSLHTVGDLAVIIERKAG